MMFQAAYAAFILLLGLPLQPVAFSPLGRGMLTGDIRRTPPHFQDTHFDTHILPIPGTCHLGHLIENILASGTLLDNETMQMLDDLFAPS